MPSERDSPVLSRHSRRSSLDQDSDELSTPRIRWAYFILGAACLLSWNAMITATPWFLLRLEGSSMRATFSSYLSTTFNVAGLLSFTYVTYNAKRIHPRTRGLRSTVVLTASLLALSMVTFVPSSPSIFFSFVLFTATIQATFGAFLQSAVIALASLFGPFAMQSTFSGQAAVGVLVSVVQFVTSAVAIYSKQSKGGEDRVKAGAFGFFFIGTMFMVVALVTYRWLGRLPALLALTGADEPRAPPLQDAEDDQEADVDEAGHLLRVESPVMEDLDIWTVFKLNAHFNFSVGYVFVVTLAVFPPITAAIQSVHPVPIDSPSIYNPILFNAFHFLVFNIGDYTGRSLCSYPQLVTWSRKRLLTNSLARTIFIPLFLACNLHSDPIINSDFIFMLILFLFGVSNGQVATNGMMASSSLEHNRRIKRGQVELAATIAQFCLVGGLALGSVCSFAVRAAVCGCNPFVE